MLTLIATTKDNATLSMWAAAAWFLVCVIWCLSQPRPKPWAFIFIAAGLLFFTFAFIILQGVKLT